MGRFYWDQGHYQSNPPFKMFKFLVFSLPLAWAASPGPRDPLHASCSVKWTLSESCASAQEKIIDQMNLWDNEDCETKPDDDKPHGQKCLYHHTGTEGSVTTGIHTTPIHRYVDDLTFTFIEGSDPTCLVDAYSVSETLSLLDYRTNYCNLFNLMDGSGLVNDPAFTEDTNNFICTQRSSADCDIY